MLRDEEGARNQYEERRWQGVVHGNTKVMRLQGRYVRDRREEAKSTEEAMQRE